MHAGGGRRALFAVVCATLGAAAGATLGPAGTAVARTETAASGAITARLAYPDDPTSAQPRLTVLRGQEVLYDGSAVLDACSEEPCLPAGAVAPGAADGSVAVRQLDGSPEPEIVLEMYTRGAHCCTVAQIWRLDGNAAAPVLERNFGNSSFEMRDGDGDGREEFWTSDDRFSYRFASFAFSGRPLRVLAYEAGGMRDVTRRFPDAVAQDAAFSWRQYERRRQYRRERLGLLAAWAADQYLLGRARHAASVIRRERRAGRIAKRSWNGRPFLRDLQRFLRRLGY